MPKKIKITRGEAKEKLEMNFNVMEKGDSISRVNKCVYDLIENFLEVVRKLATSTVLAIQNKREKVRCFLLNQEKVTQFHAQAPNLLFSFKRERLISQAALYF